MTSTSSSETLARLRAATATAHRELENQVNISQVCGRRESYEQLLEDFLGFWEPLEASLQQIPGWKERGFDWDERAKAGLLEADLRALGRTAAEIGVLPRCTDLPHPQSLEAAFGCAYVVEGSTLGGRHILGVLAGTDIPEEARHYFSSYGDRVGERWREFCAMLGGFPAAEAERMVPQAIETFHTLSAWLDRPR